MKAVAKLAAFEISTREDVMSATEVEIHARLVVRNDGLITEVEEVPIKSLIETVVGECVTLQPMGKTKEVAE